VFSGNKTRFDMAIFSSQQTNFGGAQFSGQQTNFQDAKFVSIEHTDFLDAEFGAWLTDFSDVEFRPELTNFSDVKFFSTEHTNFSDAAFSAERTNFAGAQFGGKQTYFHGTNFFSGERTNFRDAKFFSIEHTDFLEAEFRGERINFGGAEFRGEQTYFRGAKFFSTGHTDFSDAEFLSTEHTDFSAKSTFRSERTLFTRAKFSSTETSFSDATFGSKKVLFSEATFKEKVVFLGTEGNAVFASQEQWVWFDHCRMDKPELLTFNTVLLHPGWFINVDARNFDFTHVAWYGFSGGPEGDLVGEIKALEDRGVQSRYSALSQACQRLSANAEQNRDYPLANEFYFWSMEALRRESWNPLKSLGLIRTLYWALSGYGVRPGNASLMLIVIWAVFAVFYMMAGPKNELLVFSGSEVWHFAKYLLTSSPYYSGLRAPSLSEIEHFWADVRPALVYSLGALARLRPEPQPDGPSWFQFFVTVEGIVGPLQIALLALAIRRKVMR
jgi:uncharacterized protein YjbI with pentapeptide repeats